MRRRSFKNRVLIDIGSTNIKYFRLDPEELILDGGYFPRDFNLVVSQQVTTILQQELDWKFGRDAVRICSSANGGLKVGIISYTERFSGAWAAKSVLNAGGNVKWLTDLANWANSSREVVDVIVIAGGVTDSPIERQLRWLEELKKLPLQADGLIFAGNPALSLAVKEYWPAAIHTENVIGEDLRWQGGALSHVLREAYITDLVSNKGISGLQEFSEVPILPTPAVVQESYRAILNSETHLQFPEPLMLIDIGGATTDVFYGGELITDTEGNFPRPSINRYVFTHLGVSASRFSLLEYLSRVENLGDFLRALDPHEAERRYLCLREGATDWVTPEFLAEACCFIALSYCAAGLSAGHKLNLERIAAIVITGGASQMCSPDRLERIFRLCGAKHSVAYLDEGYRIWIEGMMRLNPNLQE